MKIILLYFSKHMYESETIQNIVEKVTQRVRLKSNDMRVVGLYGMNGI